MRARLAMLAVFLIYALQAAIAQAPLSEAAAKKWIAAALKNERRYDNDKGVDAVIASAYSPNESRDAWLRLKRCRDAGNSLDLSLAGAEHYLYMRFVASERGDTDIRKLPKWYESFKSWATENDLQGYLRTSDQPVSPMDKNVTRWGEAGVEAGLKEYKDREKKEPSSKSSTVLLFVGVGYAVYIKYLPALPVSCTVGVS